MGAAVQKPVGCYYMPNWRLNPADPRPWKRDSWSELRRLFPEFEPLKGFYDEADPAIMDQSIREARAAGLTYFAFDTFHDHTTGKFVGDHALKNFNASKERGLQFSIALDTTNDEVPVTCLQDWLDLCDQLVAYFDDPRYLRINGRPVVTMVKFAHAHAAVTKGSGLFDALPAPLAGQQDMRQAQAHKQLLQIARERTGQEIYWIGGVDANPHWVWQLDESGYDAHSWYNMFNQQFGIAPGPMPQSYAELSANYLAAWKWLLRGLKPRTDMWLAMTMGWDARTLKGGSLIGRGTPAEVEAHFRDALALITAEAKIVGAVVCAWNEHTEGSVMEPLKTLGRQMLGTFRKVFAP